MRVMPVALLAMLLMTPAALAEDMPNVGNFQAGREYFELPSPRVLAEKDDGRIEVIAFFWYNCGACYFTDPKLTAWAETLPDDIRLIRMPFSYSQTTDVHARIFFALRELGKGHDADLAVFRLFQDQRQPVHEPGQLPRLAKALNINELDLINAYNSPEVSARMDKMHKLITAYNLNGVPSMVINGKYMFDIGATQGPEGYFQLADFLIARERRAGK